MTTEKTLSPSTTVSRTSDILFDNVGEEIVMMNMDKGMYYALDEIAGEIWKMIEEPISVADLCTALLKDFDVSPEDCERDTLAYLQDLQERELLEIHK